MPPRKVDERKTRKALRKLRRAVERSDVGGEDAKLSDWEQEFAQSVEQRLERFGSAFRDGSKGRLEEPLSARQAQKLTEIARKSRGKGDGLKRSTPLKAKRSSLKRKGAKWTPRVRQIEDDGSDEPDR